MVFRYIAAWVALSAIRLAPRTKEPSRKRLLAEIQKGLRTVAGLAPMGALMLMPGRYCVACFQLRRQARAV